MGFFDRLFKKDPKVELELLEEQVRKQENLEKAWRIAQRLAETPDEKTRSRANELVLKIGQILSKELLEKAERSKEKGNLLDTIDWLSAAIEYLPDEEKSTMLQQISRLEQHLDDDTDDFSIMDVRKEPEVEFESEMDVEIHFEMLLGMLTEKYAEQYRHQSPSFQRAIVFLNSGHFSNAATLLDEILASGDHNLALFERGRCALLMKEPAKAIPFLEKAWSALGDDYLDENETLSAPLLWSEAQLQADQPSLVVERLSSLANAPSANTALSLVYGRSLKAALLLDEARTFLIGKIQKFPKAVSLYILLSRVLQESSKGSEAIEVLETIVRPSCSAGNCNNTSKNPAAIRYLIEPYLEHPQNLPRAGELLRHLELAMEGNLLKSDLLMAASYHRLTGDPKAAQKAEQQAECLTDEHHEQIPTIQQVGQRAVL